MPAKALKVGQINTNLSSMKIVNTLLEIAMEQKNRSKSLASQMRIWKKGCRSILKRINQLQKKN